MVYMFFLCSPNLPHAGTGKSVTGAHIAYALATKLKMENAGRHRGSDEPSPCVMYCGPSQQSVNVVLSEYMQFPCASDMHDIWIGFWEQYHGSGHQDFAKF